MYTIRQETKTKIRSNLLIDNMGERYKTTSGYYTVTIPNFWTIDKNLFFLLRNSDKKIFEPKYIMKPDYLSFDEYGTEILDYLLMYINNIYSAEEFNLDEVIVPSYSAIISISKDKFPKKSYDKLSLVDW